MPMTERGAIMAGRRGLVMGVANERSIAWGIAAALAAEGAELAFTYQGDALGKRVRPLAESVDSPIVLPCDVEDEGSLEAVFRRRAWYVAEPSRIANRPGCCGPINGE